MVILEGGALRRRDLAWANANFCAASGLAELDPPTCWDLCASGSPQASPRRELIDPGSDGATCLTAHRTGSCSR